MDRESTARTARSNPIWCRPVNWSKEFNSNQIIKMRKKMYPIWPNNLQWTSLNSTPSNFYRLCLPRKTPYGNSQASLNQQILFLRARLLKIRSKGQNRAYFLLWRNKIMRKMIWAKIKISMASQWSQMIIALQSCKISWPNSRDPTPCKEETRYHVKTLLM